VRVSAEEGTTMQQAQAQGFSRAWLATRDAALAFVLAYVVLAIVESAITGVPLVFRL